MLLIFIGIIISACFFYYVLDFPTEFVSVLSCTFGLCIGVIMWIYLGGIIGAALPQTKTIETFPIESLSITAEENGIAYLYEIKSENGNQYKEIKDSKSSTITIYKGDYESHVIFYKNSLKETWYFLFANDMYIKNPVEFYISEDILTN